MQKFKLFLIILIIVVFSLFIGFEIRDYGNGNFTKAFLTTLIFGITFIIITTAYYVGAKTSFVRLSKGKKEDYSNPLDIWLLSIPMCVLMIVAYLILQWHVAEIFFCTMISLSGMLFADNLGRGNGKWHIEKSLPFFIGCVVTIIYGIVIGGMK